MTTGNTISSNEYIPQGNVIFGTENLTIICQFCYRSYYSGIETELFYLQIRYYDSAIGRFVNADNVEHLGINGSLLSFNSFTYGDIHSEDINRKGA